MSTDREPVTKEEVAVVYYLLACGFIGVLGSAGEVWALSARHFMSYTNLLGSTAIGFAGLVIGLAVGIFSFTAGGKRR